MLIVALKEASANETRIALTPDAAKKFLSIGALIAIESSLGAHLSYPDEEYEKLGVTIEKDRKKLLSKADIILAVQKPSLDEISLIKPNAVYLSFLDPFREKETLTKLASANITSISLEMLPRTTLAQKMDALSSQANLAGYVSVILAASKTNKILPMMTTPAGTISPLKVFVIGVGVAGLQAIATAKRLGARVEAFDTRPACEEQVKSLGAKFVKIDLGDMGQTKGGYAKALTDEQLQKQREEIQRVCSGSDIIITTAQVFGRKAPVIITKSMLKTMKPGSVIVDMAVESGGNVEEAKLNQTVKINDVQIVGLANLPAKVALPASQVYSSNLFHFVHHFWDKETKTFKVDLADELLKACVVTHNQKIQLSTERK